MIDAEVVGDCCGREAILAVAVVVEVGVAAAAVTGGGSQISGTRPEVQPRVWPVLVVIQM
jgi:hypothetical protein